MDTILLRQLEYYSTQARYIYVQNSRLRSPAEKNRRCMWIAAS